MDGIRWDLPHAALGSSAACGGRRPDAMSLGTAHRLQSQAAFIDTTVPRRTRTPVMTAERRAP